MQKGHGIGKLANEHSHTHVANVVSFFVSLTIICSQLAMFLFLFVLYLVSLCVCQFVGVSECFIPFVLPTTKYDDTLFVVIIFSSQKGKMDQRRVMCENDIVNEEHITTGQSIEFS